MKRIWVIPGTIAAIGLTLSAYFCADDLQFRLPRGIRLLLRGAAIFPRLFPPAEPFAAIVSRS